MGLIIEQIEYYLPENKVTNNDLSIENPSWEMEKAEGKSGVKNRYLALEDETSLDLAIKAIDKLHLKDGTQLDKINAIIFCTQSPDYIMPANSFLIHKHFKFSEKVWSFDLNLACSGYVYGLAIAKGMIESGMAKCVLLVTAETYSKYTNPKDRSTRILFGDAAAASILTNDISKGIIDIILSTSGEKFDTFYIPAGGMKTPKNIDTKQISSDSSGNSKSLENIHMNGFAVWQFISKKVSEQITELLNRNNLSVDDIDLFVFHQASKLTLDSLIKALGVSSNKVFTNIEKVGNTVSSSIPIALKDAEDAGKLKRNNLIILSGFGVGLSWGSILMKY